MGIIETKLPRVPEIQDLRLDEVYIKESKRQWFLGEGKLDGLEEALSLKEVADIDKGNVLDVACGCGERAYFLAEVSPNFDITAIDIDPRCIETAQARYRPMPPNLHFKLGDVYDLSAYHEMDMVTTSQALHHFDRLEDALAQILQAMKRGAEFYFMDLNREHLPCYEGETQLPGGRKVPKAHFIYEVRKKVPDNEFAEAFLKNEIFDHRQSAHTNRMEILTICSYIAAYTPLEVQQAMSKAGFRIIEITRKGGLMSGIGLK